MVQRGKTATTDGTDFALNLSIDPLHAVMFPRPGLRRVSTPLRKKRFFSVHTKFNRSVCSDLVVIATGNISAFGKIGPKKWKGGERGSPKRFHYVMETASPCSTDPGTIFLLVELFHG